MLPTDTSFLLQSETDLLPSYLIVIQFQDMLHTPLIAVFFIRHVDLSVIPEYAMILKIFIFQLTLPFFIRAVDSSHIIFKSPLNPHVTHVAVALEPFALQAAERPESLFKNPPVLVSTVSCEPMSFLL